MDYFTYNAARTFTHRIRCRYFADQLIDDVLHEEREHESGAFPALFMSARHVLARRLEGARTHKRGMANEMPYHVYPARARHAFSYV